MTSRQDEEYDLGRYELKYCVPVALRDEIVALAAEHTAPDPHGVALEHGGRGYVVRSLYFDTPRHGDLIDRLGERRVRDRLRIRTYGYPGQGQPVFLENKRKYLDRVIKHRVRVADADRFCAAPTSRPWRDLSHEVRPKGRFAFENFDRCVARRLPRTVVVYEREVYVTVRDDDPKIRLTMDRFLRAGRVDDPRELYADAPIPLIPDDWMVMELKFDRNKPAWMRQICRALELRAGPVSKFGLSMTRVWHEDRPAWTRYLTPVPLRRLHPPPRPARAASRDASPEATL